MFACIHSAAVAPESSLSDFAYAFSPVVEETAPGTIVIDVEGCDLLFGSAYQLANEVARRAKQPPASGGLSTSVRVAIAANPDAAIHAATRLPGITFISPGEELGCLGEFPLQHLNYALAGVAAEVAAEISETLRLWGVRTFGDFAALPVIGVSERLGQEGVRLQQLAAGKTERRLFVKQPAPVFANSLELEHPLRELEPLSFIFARLLHQLCAALNSYALATNELRVDLQLEDQTVHERRLSLPYPMRDHKVFLKLLLLDAEMHPPAAAVTGISLACEPVKPRVLQSGLFVPLAPAPDKLELTLARLTKLVGEGNLGSPALLDTHRPDAFTINKFVLPGRTNHRRSDREARQCLGLRVFRPPLRAVVETAQGIPAQISAWGKERSVYGKVVQLAGPWRTTGDWWREDRWARDEWDVAVTPSNKTRIEPRGLYRIYRQLESERWFVEGNYD